MTIRQQNANDELVHKLRSMLNDLPTLRTRAMKKLKYWREAAIKRLLARQRELEKTLLDKFERLEFDTQLFVEKIERKKANQQRRWQTEPLDYPNKTEIDRISTNLRSIREELEQSKLILAGSTVEDDVDDIVTDDLSPGKFSEISRYNGSLSSKVPLNKTQENNDLGSELKRVLEICTSPQRSSSSLSTDELSPLRSLNHIEHSSNPKVKQNSPSQTKRGSQTVGTQRRHSRILKNIPIQQQQQQQQINSTNGNEENNSTNGSVKDHKLFAFESFDESIRRFQRLREIRKNLRTKYDDQAIQSNDESKSNQHLNGHESNSDNRSVSQQKLLNYINRSISTSTNSIPPTPPPATIQTSINANNNTTPRKNPETRHTNFMRESVNIPIERVVNNTTSVNQSDIVELYDKAANSVDENPVVTKTNRDRRYRSRTLETHQIQAVDNQIYGCPSSSAKSKTTSQHRSESHQHRTQRLSFRRSSDDHQEKQLQIRRNHQNLNGSFENTFNENWFDIDREHWVNLLENGWRPTADTPGVTSVAIVDSDHQSSRGRKQEEQNQKSIDLYEQISKTEYYSLFEQFDFAYARTINLGNEFWRFLEINGDHHLCLYHQLNKQFIMYKPDASLLSFPWPYDGIVDISWSKTTNNWIVATQTQIIICNCSFSKILQSIDINGDWPKRITSCQSSIFHTYKIPASSTIGSSSGSFSYSSNKDRPQFLLERYDYKLNSIGKHILESSTIWDIEADDRTEHLAILCDVALLIFDYQLNLLKRIEVTGFKVSRDHFGGWIVADYNGSCLWQIRRNEYVKANKILHVERPWSAILDQSSWTLVTLSETQNRAKRLLFFGMKNIPASLQTVTSPKSQSHLSNSISSSISTSSP